MSRFSILFLVLFTACSVSEKEKENVKAMQEEAPRQEAFNVHYLYSDSAVVKARLSAPHVYEEFVNDVQYSVFDLGMKLEFFAPNGEIQSVLTGEHARINMEKGLAVVTGNVVVVNNVGERMETERMTWNKSEDKVRSDAFVKIIRKDEIVYGDSLEASPDFGSYKIFKIRGIINMQEE